MKEHVVEVTIMGYQGNILLSTIIAPRTFVTINPSHLGFEEDELVLGKDEFTTIKEIGRIITNKTIIGYDIKKTMRLCDIHTYAIHEYIDLERHELLRRKCGVFTNKIKLPQMTKKFNIRAKFPMRTALRCVILKQLWEMINGEEYQIQAIIATPTKDPHQTLFCQTSSSKDSQGREILKGGRNVRDHEVNDKE